MDRDRIAVTVEHFRQVADFEDQSANDFATRTKRLAALTPEELADYINHLNEESVKAGRTLFEAGINGEKAEKDFTEIRQLSLPLGNFLISHRDIGSVARPRDVYAVTVDLRSKDTLSASHMIATAFPMPSHLSVKDAARIEDHLQTLQELCTVLLAA